MEVREIQRIAAVLKGVGEPSATSCPRFPLAFSLALSLALALTFCSGVAKSQPVSTKVSTAEQAAREDDRLLILRNELKKSEALVESLAKRRAERLAASDMVAADEAENDRIRVLSDIAGIKREIASTRPTASPPEAGSSTAGVRVGTAKPVQPKTEKAAPWWDVYGKSGRATASGSDTSAQASRPTSARFEPSHRME